MSTRKMSKIKVATARVSSRFAVVGLVAAGLGFAATPVVAFDEGRGSTADLLLGILGVTEKSDEATINYRERAPLVLPPKTELRQPRPAAAQRAGNWPQDQESVAAAKRRAQQGKVPLDRVTEGVQVAGARELAGNRTAATARVQGPGPCVMDTDRSNPNACPPEVFWNSLKVKSEEKPELQAGVEPDRKYLTQPPKGYMKATRNQKATFEPQRKDEEHPRDFFIKPQSRQE